jgi:ArsR family transcriptional regulator, arsenate/arsenite/antimonite-responsive transcriptional repressor
MDAAEVVEGLTALAQESRLAVFRLLVRYGMNGLPAGKIAEALGVPPPTLSFHLTQLSHAGLVRSRREGRQVSYSADFARMNALLQFLTANCCVDAAGACGPVRVERKESHASDRKRPRSK